MMRDTYYIYLTVQLAGIHTNKENIMTVPTILLFVNCTKNRRQKASNISRFYLSEMMDGMSLRKQAHAIYCDLFRALKMIIFR